MNDLKMGFLIFDYYMKVEGPNINVLKYLKFPCSNLITITEIINF